MYEAVKMSRGFVLFFPLLKCYHTVKPPGGWEEESRLRRENPEICDEASNPAHPETSTSVVFPVTWANTVPFLLKPILIGFLVILGLPWWLRCSGVDPGLIPRLERSPGEGNGNPSSILAWRIPLTEEPGGLQSMGSQRVGHNWMT